MSAPSGSRHDAEPRLPCSDSIDAVRPLRTTVRSRRAWRIGGRPAWPRARSPYRRSATPRSANAARIAARTGSPAQHSTYSSSVERDAVAFDRIRQSPASSNRVSAMTPSNSKRTASIMGRTITGRNSGRETATEPTAVSRLLATLVAPFGSFIRSRVRRIQQVDRMNRARSRVGQPESRTDLHEAAGVPGGDPIRAGRRDVAKLRREHRRSTSPARAGCRCRPRRSTARRP